jgi:hypothetical protein
MSPSDEHTPLVARINEDAIEQGFWTPASNKRPSLVVMQRAVAGVVTAVFLCAVTVVSFVWWDWLNIHEFRINEEFRSLGGAYSE